MRIVLTGATGRAGHPAARHLSRMGHEVTTLGRRPSVLGLPHLDWQLGGPCPDLGFADALVHAAFDHVPGRYRGGEGDDAPGFIARNRDGTLRLFDAVRGRRIVFLSSRAVYGSPPPGTSLPETREPAPDTLYGKMKREVEIAVTDRGGVSLRATGLYGPPRPGKAHKWADLFADFSAGRPIAPRVATELHVDDLATAVALALDLEQPQILNVSDIVLDRCDLLGTWGAIHGIAGPLPRRADASSVREMETTRLRALGWTPRGMAGLRDTLAGMRP
ncbi:NAD(P)-dependent oxidoreductase [Palleronia sp. LCG004]|uniref:NAD-dependent epimerase/dehydratase family protein n=1 Tax=Palleronia sp. LCG004 TaxID=3079304 RepID=UPI002942CF0C|nr:NAD(P)-dependent oxidoreductase [Palleronia sp. LCG004]WOI58055.1 NAD(P)-dependent oxidoreductase [Palleronia sp. LCG004]